MADEDKTIMVFATRLRQLVLDFEKLKAENQRLREEIDHCEAKVKDVQAQLKSAQDNYNRLLTAKMLEVGEGDLEAAKARLAKLIRSVNKCITLLSEK